MQIDRRPVHQRLADFYVEHEIGIRLRRPHPQLAGHAPADMITRGEVEAVHVVIDRFDEGAFI